MLETDARWFSIGGEATNATCYGRAFFDGSTMTARILDTNVGTYVHKLYTLVTRSCGIEISRVNFDIDMTQAAGRNFYVVISAGVNQQQIFTIQAAGIYMIEFPAVLRQLYTQTGGGGAAITSTGVHEWEFVFDEVAKTFRVFQDGMECFADDGVGGTFNAYYQAAANFIGSLQIASGNPAGGGAAESTDLDITMDNIEVSWYPNVTVSPRWNELPADNENGTSITHSICRMDTRRAMVLRDTNGLNNIEIEFDFNGNISSGKLYFEIFPFTSVDAADMLNISLYDGVTECIHLGINPQNQNVYVWVIAVQTDTGLDVNLDEWNTVEMIFRPDNCRVKVNGVLAGPFNTVANQVDGINTLQFITDVVGAGHNIFIDNLGVSWL